MMVTDKVYSIGDKLKELINMEGFIGLDVSSGMQEIRLHITYELFDYLFAEHGTTEEMSGGYIKHSTDMAGITVFALNKEEEL